MIRHRAKIEMRSASSAPCTVPIYRARAPNPTNSLGYILAQSPGTRKGQPLTSTHHSFRGPAARFERKGNAIPGSSPNFPPRAPAEDFVPCTPVF